MKVELWIGGEMGEWCLGYVLGTPGASRVLVRVGDERPGRASSVLAGLDGLEVTHGDLNAHEPAGDVAVLVHYHEILKPETVARYRRVYNIHPGYLPWGRGMFPVFWAFLEGPGREPAGATVHEVVEGLDQGPIVAQAHIDPAAHGSAATVKELHDLVVQAERDLFADFWTRLLDGTLPEVHPQVGRGSYHSRADFERLRTRWTQEFKPRERDMRLRERKQAQLMFEGAEDVLKLIRAYSFPGYPGLVIDGVEYTARKASP